MSEENKFSFSEEEQQSPQESTVSDKKQAVKEDAKGLFASISSFISELLDFRDDTDREATIAAIKADIPFKGATAWILICSIMVASVGLNADSTAVVIGAMLISPLMGPILGVGMSIALNDIDTLKKSLINLAVMIVLSLLTAFLFFKFFPTADIPNDEIFGRTKPDLRDVFIAFFGGLALIIARTKKGTIASVIFGVAIATALMPPLCVAGYGLANDPSAFKGAMFLFTINTIFIALATFIVLKVLRFPMLKYANSKRRKRIAQLASLLAIVVMVPAVITFYDVYKESLFNTQAEDFIENKIRNIEGIQLLNDNPSYPDNSIELSFMNEISDQTKSIWINELKTNEKYDALTNVKLRIKDGDTKSFDLISSAYSDAREQLKESKLAVSRLEKQIEELEENISGLNQQLEAKNASDEVAFSTLAKDTKIRFNDLEYFAYAKMLESKDFIKVDTVTIANVRWKTSLSDSLIGVKEAALLSWLKEELKTEKIRIKRN